MLVLQLALLSPTYAQEREEPPRELLQQAAARLQSLTEQLRPAVEAMEVRKEPPSAEEMQSAQPRVDSLRAAVAEVEDLVSATGGSETPQALRSARKLLQRIAALDLVRRAAELRSNADELGARSDPPTDEELAELRRVARELQSKLLELEALSGGGGAAKQTTRDVEHAVALSESVEVLAQAEEAQDVLEELESRPGGPSESETEEILEAADDLKDKIERVVQQVEVGKGADEPEGLRRARSILNRLLAVDVIKRMEPLLPEVDRLEHEAAPPSAEELDGLRSLVELLRDAVETLEKSLTVDSDEELPPEFVQARDLLHRAALLDLWRSNTDLRPEIEAFEQQQGPLSPEDVTRLRAIPGELRPKVRTARRSAKQDPLVRDESTSPLISEATDLLNRVQALVPDTATAVEEPVDAPDTQPVKKPFRFYGSLRARALVFTDGRTELDGQTSRIGVRAEGKLLKGLSAFTRAELGFNFLEASNRLISGDPGRTDSEDSSIFFSRLLFIGAEVGKDTLSFGKQWSAYYDVAVFSDQMPYFAGAGAGVYNAETDGGHAGTGRADQALQYRGATGAFKFTGQIQIRNLTDNNQTIADTVGGSSTWKIRDELSVGAGFSIVRDGIPDAEPTQPREDESAFIVGSRYKTERLYAAGTFSIFNNHETDELGRFFGGIGLELYAAYDLSKRLKLRGALSYLRPESSYPGDYEILSVTTGASYDATDRIRVLLLARIDGSRLSDGSDRDADVLSVAVFYNF